ncbi:hypothetical protein [Schinkia azotoformans]|uniref:hypothetical protein n=1 Tax=Schinkia azotoformans TaxID=1454 RepID=UPI002DBF24B3|nr:hypothetical protein [Schinkia azotoformans]MEC1744165.1 hypothetical protein [Schinkia azotoformans]
MGELFTIKKLIVISEIENSSRELNFSSGLNIILGKENKSGKSSLVKSIFHTFGCKVKFEDDWEDLIKYYIVYFEYNNIEYVIVRKNIENHYFIFKEDSSTSNNFVFVNEFDNFGDFSEIIMRILNTNIRLTDKSGIGRAITPPLLFAFNYIDQDLGWNNIGNNFLNTSYFKDWKNNTIKFVVGYQNKEYFDLKELEDAIRTKINEKEKEISYIKKFIVKLEEAYKSKTTNTEIKENESLLKELNILEKKRIAVANDLNSLKNERYQLTLRLSNVKAIISDLSKDHEYANELPDTLFCPFCGSDHHNDFDNKLEIIKDIKNAQELLGISRKELNEIEEEIKEIEELYSQTDRLYKKTYIDLKNKEDTANIINNFKAQGRSEILKTSSKELSELIDENNGNILVKNKIENNIKELISQKRSTKIRNSIKDRFADIKEQVNITKNKYSFKNFMIVIKNFTGSEFSRVIFSYYVALFLYNKERQDYPFKFLVIDTPNQQGQNSENLKKIFSTFNLLRDKKGQVIVGTERETGYEQFDDVNVIEVTKVRKCLTKSHYNEHCEIINKLLKIAKYESLPRK